MQTSTLIRRGTGALAAAALVAATAIAAPAIADPEHGGGGGQPGGGQTGGGGTGGGGTGGGGGGTGGGPGTGGGSGGGEATGRTISLVLNGARIPGGGDPNGRGTARFELSPDRASVCFEIRWRGLDGVVTAAHVHRAARGATGPHHIDLVNDEHLVGERNLLAACVQVQDGGHGHGGGGATAAETIEQVIASPKDFYLNVHTTAFPAGAIRGQLGT